MSKKLDTLMDQVAEVATERKELEVKEKALKEALMDEMRKERVRRVTSTVASPSSHTLSGFTQINSLIRRTRSRN
jgi:hypothetical protein